jgi:cytochrome c oxidase cbb3-type subunit 3
MRQAVLCILLTSALHAASTGESLFATNCAPCHGPKGDGGKGSNLAVRRLPRAPDDAALAAIIATGIPGTQMPGTRMTAAESAQLVAFVRSLGRTAQAQVPGDRTRGEQLFWTKGNCGECHTIGPRGGRFGPDLTTIGEKRSPSNLRTSILDPEAEVPENFASYRKVIYAPDNFLQIRATTADGKTITGVRVNEDTFTIQLRDASGKIYSFRKSDLRDLQKDWGKSPMPSFRSVFTDPELQDLIAYLSSLQAAP